MIKNLILSLLFGITCIAQTSSYKVGGILLSNGIVYSSGFKYLNAAPTGHYLRGNGTIYIDSALSSSDISGVLSPSSLGTGTADSTKYLRGDGTWQTYGAGAGGDVYQNGTNIFTGTNNFTKTTYVTNVNNLLGGDGSRITGLTSSSLSGIIPTANLGTGTANSLSYLAGNSAWISLVSSKFATVNLGGATGTGTTIISTNLYTANSLSSAGDSLEFWIAGKVIDSSGVGCVSTITFNFGTSSGQINLTIPTADTNAHPWLATWKIYYVSGSSSIVIIQLVSDLHSETLNFTGSDSFSSNLIISISGSNSTSAGRVNYTAGKEQILH